MRFFFVKNVGRISFTTKKTTFIDSFSLTILTIHTTYLIFSRESDIGLLVRNRVQTARSIAESA